MRAVAPEILAVTGLLAAVGLLVLIPALLFIPDAVKLISHDQSIVFGGAGTFFTLLGVLLLALGLELAAFGAILLYLARSIFLGDRVGRGLTLVIAGCTVAAYFLGLVAGDQTVAGSPSGTVTGVLALLGAIGVIAILFFSPRARAHFDRHDDRPVSVATASTLIAWVAVAGIIDGAILVGFATYKTSFVVYGVLFLLASFGLLGLNRQLRAGSAGARWGATAVAVVYLVVSVLVLHDTFDYVQLAIGLSIIGLLWLPPEAEAHFGSRLDLSRFMPAPQPSWQAASVGASAGATGHGYGHPQAAGFCPQCSTPAGGADHFCQNCGAGLG
jgi:hypothetical protein